MRFIMLNKGIKWLAAAAFTLSLFFTTCEMPMGLGDPVDTVPPTVFINSPQDNTKMKAITRGNPIIMSGVWMDDIAVTSMRFEFVDKWKGNVTVTPSKISYRLATTGSSEGWITGTWTAEIVIDANVATEYRIRVYVLDAFGNQGMSEVNVQIDIIPPWIDGVRIQRHPTHPNFSVNSAFVQSSDSYTAKDTGSTSGKRDSLPNHQYYIDKGFDVNDVDLWRNIKWDDISEFQNESFRISTQLISTFDNVAATRLNIYDETNRLITTDMLPPTGYTQTVDPINLTHLRYPYWDITHQTLANLYHQLNSGMHYISFEIRAWSKTDWEGDDLTGYPKKDLSTGEEEPGRSQRAGGTMWFPESDNPHPYIDRDLIIGETNTIILAPNTASALKVELYDDDLLSSIYMGLVPKTDFDDLRTTQSETAYLNSLTAESSTGRAALMAKCISVNSKDERFSAIADTPNIYRTFDLATASEGEFRLIIFVKEGAKNTAGYSFTNTDAKWSVYPPLRVQVQSGQAPLIIVENPLRENAFPNLNSDGQTFILSGYMLSATRTERTLIAWIPPGKTQADGTTALTAAELAYDSWSSSGLYTHAATGVKVWIAAIEDQGQDTFGSTSYFKTGFTKTFDILTDFLVSGVNSFNGSAVANSFIIKAHASNGADATKAFRMFGTSAAPHIDVTSHTAIQNYHDRGVDLVLRMLVTGGTDGVALKPGSFLITDTGTGGNVSATTLNQNGEWQATVPKETIQSFAEGSNRVYRFAAENILGIQAAESKTIIMSNAPYILSILCNNGSGSYKEGDVLVFDVTYSMPVLVEGQPRLKLHFGNVSGVTASTGPDIYAAYVAPASSTATNVLQFTYTVKRGDDTTQLKNSLYPIDKSLTGTTLKSYYASDAGTTLNSLTEGKSLQEKQTVLLDGLYPTVSRAAFDQVGTAPTYFTTGKTITMNLLCSEPVMVSGTPKATIAIAGSTTTLTAEYSSTIGGNTLAFTYTVASSVSISSESQLSWGSPYITLDGGSITDMVGNPLDFTTNALPSSANRQGAAGTVYTDNRTAFIKTTKPGTPVLSIYSTQAGAQNATAGALLSASPLNTRGDFLYIRATGIETAGSTYTVYYSLTGGSDPKTNLAGTGATRYSSGNDNSIADVNYASRTSTSYTPSSYQVTVWQVDRAGNESDKATARNITINSRPADLNGIEITLTDGAHGAGTTVPIKLSFAQKITFNTNPRVQITMNGTDSLMNGTANIDTNTTSTTTLVTPTSASSMITINWVVPKGTQAMKDIKFTNIQFTNMVDEYGNPLTQYLSTANSDSGTVRPIATDSLYQLSRPNLTILSDNPRLVQTQGSNNTSPIIPVTTGTVNTRNGGTLASGGSLTLVFAESASNLAVPLTAVAGKYITIRPYGTWAIPPVLTVEEFNTLYNFNYGSANTNTENRRRLSDVDDNGLPKSGSGRGSGYNLYIKNTQGISSNANVRPDTTTKMVLAFTTDLYEGTDTTALRNIFNAAGWKQQKILVTSNNVSIASNIITVKLPTALDAGRIWEVEIDEGAFQDAARNQSERVAPGAYRFWSAGTATPFIRVDKISYDNRDLTINGNNPHRHADLNFVTSNGTVNRPPIDTPVRIDCETPGADIRFNVIRTSYALSDAFTSTSNTDNAFFGSTGINTTNPVGTNTAGYQRNTIGNDDVTNTNNLSDGFFNKLLVPTAVNTGTATLSNGTFAKSTLETLGTNISLTQGGGTGTSYQSYSAAGARTWGGNNITGSYKLYIGEMHGLTSESTRIPTADNTAGLYSGRRDYIVAKAQKFSVTASGSFNGPELSASSPGMEGVYKTTLLYRNPQKINGYGQNGPNSFLRVARILVQGFDIPVMPVVAGFPIRDADSTNVDETTYGNIFSKNAYRLNATTVNNYRTNPDSDADNNHIWVTWEIVTDWYQKGKGFNALSGNYLHNDNRNANSITATYGGIIYRYGQWFYQ